MSNSKELQIKNSFIYILSTMIGNAVPIVTLPIFTRILSKEDYGLWALAQIYAVFVSGFANFGLIIGCERNFFQYKELKKISELLYSTLSFVIVISAFFAVLTYLFKSSFSRWIIGSSEHSNLLFWSYCATVIMGLKAYYLTYFKNMEDAKSYIFYTIDELFLGVVFSLFFVAYLRVGVVGLIWGQLIASLLVFALITRHFLKLHPFVFSWEVLKDSLKLSYPLTPRIFFGIIGSQFDKYMIGLLASVGGVGIYSIGQKMAYVVFTYMTTIQNVYSPQVYKRMFELGAEGGNAVGKYLTPFLYASIAIALIVSLFAEEAIRVLTPDSYHGATIIVIVLSVYYGFLFFGKQPQLIFAKKTFLTSIFTLVSIALNIGFNIPFIMKWGAVGAAWGTCLAGLVTGTVSFLISQYYYKIDWEYKKVFVILGLFLASAMSTVMLMHLQTPYVSRLAVKFFSLGCFLCVGIKLRVVTAENVRTIKKIILSLPVKVKTWCLGNCQTQKESDF